MSIHRDLTKDEKREFFTRLAGLLDDFDVYIEAEYDNSSNDPLATIAVYGKAGDKILRRFEIDPEKLKAEIAKLESQ